MLALDGVSVWAVSVGEPLRETVAGGKTFGVTPGVGTGGRCERHVVTRVSEAAVAVGRHHEHVCVAA